MRGECKANSFGSKFTKVNKVLKDLQAVTYAKGLFGTGKYSDLKVSHLNGGNKNTESS